MVLIIIYMNLFPICSSIPDRQLKEWTSTSMPKLSFVFFICLFLLLWTYLSFWKVTFSIQYYCILKWTFNRFQIKFTFIQISPKKSIIPYLLHITKQFYSFLFSLLRGNPFHQLLEIYHFLPYSSTYLDFRFFIHFFTILHSTHTTQERERKKSCQFFWSTWMFLSYMASIPNSYSKTSGYISIYKKRTKTIKIKKSYHYHPLVRMFLFLGSNLGDNCRSSWTHSAGHSACCACYCSYNSTSCPNNACPHVVGRASHPLHTRDTRT